MALFSSPNKFNFFCQKKESGWHSILRCFCSQSQTDAEWLKWKTTLSDKLAKVLPHHGLLILTLIINLPTISSSIRFVQKLVLNAQLASDQRELKGNWFIKSFRTASRYTCMTEREPVLLLTSRHADVTLPAKVAEFQDASLRVEKEVLRFDIPVTYPIGVDVRQRAE